METNKQNDFMQMKQIILGRFAARYSDICKLVTYLFANLKKKHRLYLNLCFSEARYLYNEYKDSLRIIK